MYYRSCKNSIIPRLTLFFALGLLVSACGKNLSPHETLWDALPESEQRRRIVIDAQNTGRYRPKDCSDYVFAVFHKNGFDIYGGIHERNLKGNGVKLIYDYLDREGSVSTGDSPLPGDIVFFSNTFDRNRDKKLNDALTHIGIVTRIEKDGTATFTHFMNNRFHENIFNLHYPNERSRNDYLRRRKAGDSPQTRYLTGQLIHGLGRMIRQKETLDDLTE